MSNLGIENLSGGIHAGQMQSPGIEKLQDAQGSGPGFGQMLENSIEKVNEHQTAANEAIKELVAGKNKNIHETMLMIERADSSFKLMMQVRNKMLEAYKEIMRMQV